MSVKRVQSINMYMYYIALLVLIVDSYISNNYYSKALLIRQTLKSAGGGDGMLSCFPSKFARLANIGSVAKAKQSLDKKKIGG